MKLRRSISGSLVLGALLVGGACTSQPGAKAVTLDVIESLETVSDEAKACMTEIVEAMSNDELKAIGKTDEDFLSTRPDDASPEMQAFIDELAACDEPT